MAGEPTFNLKSDVPICLNKGSALNNKSFPPKAVLERIMLDLNTAKSGKTVVLISNPISVWLGPQIILLKKSSL